jgi:hypothetical protein
MTLEQIDDRLQRLADAVEHVGANLLELDLDADRKLYTAPTDLARDGELVRAYQELLKNSPTSRDSPTSREVRT